MFQGLIVNYIKFYLVQSLVFLIQICIACKWPNQPRLLECKVMEFVLHVLRTLTVFMLGVYITFIILVGWLWYIQISVEGNVTSYNLIDSCTIKMWFHPRTAQIYVTFSRVRIRQSSILLPWTRNRVTHSFPGYTDAYMEEIICKLATTLQLI